MSLIASALSQVTASFPFCDLNGQSVSERACYRFHQYRKYLLPKNEGNFGPTNKCNIGDPGYLIPSIPSIPASYSSVPNKGTLPAGYPRRQQKFPSKYNLSFFFPPFMFIPLRWHQREEYMCTETRGIIYQLLKCAPSAQPLVTGVKMYRSGI